MLSNKTWQLRSKFILDFFLYPRFSLAVMFIDQNTAELIFIFDKSKRKSQYQQLIYNAVAQIEFFENIIHKLEHVSCACK